MKALLAAAMLAISGPAPATTIYLCKAYNDSLFWSSDHCNRHNAFIERIDNVADGVPWDQQVQQAEQAWRRGAGQATAASNDSARRDQRCRALIAERDKIESRYTNFQWQPPEVINPDQQRMRALRGELAANQCVSQ